MDCVLHIGTEKTGTTLLQDWLYQNKSALGEQRIFLSEVLSVNNNRRLVSFFQRDLDDWTTRNQIFDQIGKDQHFKTFLSDFTQEIENASDEHDCFIVTSEHFHSRLRDKGEIIALHEFLTQVFDSLKVVCYFREQSQMAQSLYSTALKGPYAVTLPDFIDSISATNYYYSPKKIADNWSDVFGVSNCDFRIYNRERFVDHDIRNDFLSCLNMNVDVQSLDFTKASSNESLSRLEGALYRVTNQLVPFWDEGQEGVSAENLRIKKLISSVDNLKCGLIADPDNTSLAEKFSNENTLFFDKYFDGEYLFSTALDTDTPATQPITFTLEQLTDIVSDFFKQFIISRSSTSVLTDNDADYLRDIALKYESHEDITLEEAAKLMGLAAKARPEGAYIIEKNTEYNIKLANCE